MRTQAEEIFELLELGAFSFGIANILQHQQQQMPLPRHLHYDCDDEWVAD